DRAENAGGEIGDRDADAHRPLPGQAGDRHQPAHALRDLVEAGAVAIGPVLAEAGNAAENDALVDLFETLIVDAEPVLDVGPVVFDHHVGLLDHAAEGGDALRRLQVERDAALVAVQVLEVGIAARAARALALFQMRRGLDLDDVGAPIGELAHASGAGAHAGQI